MNWPFFFSFLAGALGGVLALAVVVWWVVTSLSAANWARLWAQVHRGEAQGWDRAAVAARLTGRQEIAAGYETLAEDCRVLARDLELVAKFKEREEGS